MLQTNPQPLTALARGQAVRTARAVVLRKLRDREIDPVVLVRTTPACLASMLVFDFLLECPGIDVGRLKQINRRAMREDVNLAVSLGELSRLRREWVAAVVRRPCCPPALTIASRPQG